MNLPRARAKNLLIQEVEDELMIYDLSISKAYCLNETAATVYKYCDGKTSFGKLKEEFRFSDDLIYFTLDELRKNQLLEIDFVSPFTGLNRREIIRKVGMGSLIALPVIASLVAPEAVNASSRCTQPGQLPGTLVRNGNFIICSADCSAPSVGAVCCTGSASTAGQFACDGGRTTCRCN